jgi:Tripartite tricarboxylate transporter family receptor
MKLESTTIVTECREYVTLKEVIDGTSTYRSGPYSHFNAGSDSRPWSLRNDFGQKLKCRSCKGLHVGGPAGAAALPAASHLARAQSYPSRPVRIIVGLAPGGTSDISARLVGQWLSERLGRQFITENKIGAAGNIAAEYVVKAAADGYTLLVFASPAAINASLYTNLNFNLIRDIAPVASILRVPDVILVNPSFPAATVPEFIAYAKANPGRVNMATAGIGTTPHIFGELFKMMTGVNMLPVHYRGGGPALTDLLGGQVQVMFDPVGEAVGYIKSGRLRKDGMRYRSYRARSRRGQTGLIPYFTPICSDCNKPERLLRCSFDCVGWA